MNLFTDDGEVQEHQLTCDFTMPNESNTVNSVLEISQEFIESKCRKLTYKKNLYSIVKMNLLNQTLIMFFSFKDGVMSHVRHIFLNNNCVDKILMNQLVELLNYLCDVAGEQVGLFVFTMETVLSVGIHQDFVNAILKRLYPNHISDQFKNFLIVNTGQHWIRVEEDGRTRIIYDSDFIYKISKFANCPKQVDKVLCGLCALCFEFNDKIYKFANCPQQVDNVSCGLHALCFELFFKYGLEITPHCLRIDDPCQVVYDLCRTFFFGQMTEVDFIRKYYRDTKNFTKIPINNTIFNPSVSVSTASQQALPPNNIPSSFSSNIPEVPKVTHSKLCFLYNFTMSNNIRNMKVKIAVWRCLET